MKESFIDKIRIYVKGGDGGSGCASFRHEKFIPLGGPDGGDGGDGGTVYLEADENMMDFLPFTFKVHFKAKRGEHGKGSKKTGKKGDDFVIKVPRGTLVFDSETGDFMTDLTEKGQRFLCGKGGRGGRGNPHFVSSVKRAPHFAEKGEPGEEQWLVLELRLLADVGIIGFPNAGKSTFLSKVSAATPRIASYAFTTIHPNLGVVTGEGGETAIFADLPGLIEGAHKGLGLGLQFLRHIERTKILLHLIDINEVSEEDPMSQYTMLRKELELYNAALVERPEIIVFNKIDCDESGEKARLITCAFNELKKKVFFISCLEGTALRPVREEIFSILRVTPAPSPVMMMTVPTEKTKPEFTVTRDGDHYVVEGKEVRKLVAMTDLENDEAVDYIQRKFKRMGVEDALIGHGAKEGDTVIIGGREFDFSP
ncbi:MAG: GTPase ObgE [Vulcanimicrobiota bacterium]